MFLRDLVEWSCYFSFICWVNSMNLISLAFGVAVLICTCETNWFCGYLNDFMYALFIAVWI